MNAAEAQTNRRNWLTVVVYALAMAWVESAVVFYLRTMVDRIEPYQATPLPMSTGLGFAEIVREVATLVMLFTVGMLAGKTWRARIGYSAIAFGVWDIFYYVFLKAMCDWPHALLDWDILFLLPLPWWGPVLAPMLISLLLIWWGTLASQTERPPAPLKQNLCAWLLNSAGGLLALYVFMADSLRVVHGGGLALRKLLPTDFNWQLFCVALALMTAPIILELKFIRSRRQAGNTTVEFNSPPLRS